MHIIELLQVHLLYVLQASDSFTFLLLANFSVADLLHLRVIYFLQLPLVLSNRNPRSNNSEIFEKLS